jgi:hypothetical protein
VPRTADQIATTLSLDPGDVDLFLADIIQDPRTGIRKLPGTEIYQFG